VPTYPAKPHKDTLVRVRNRFKELCDLLYVRGTLVGDTEKYEVSTDKGITWITEFEAQELLNEKIEKSKANRALNRIGAKEAPVSPTEKWRSFVGLSNKQFASWRKKKSMDDFSASLATFGYSISQINDIDLIFDDLDIESVPQGDAETIVDAPVSGATVDPSNSTSRCENQLNVPPDTRNKFLRRPGRKSSQKSA
jgi:hypothetical protein